MNEQRVASFTGRKLLVDAAANTDEDADAVMQPVN